ncbi:hypothetical protein KIPB_002573 [Kipferlia bialata]|uniref:Putative amidase domain-containing protein n=1 Tax=Kipferlia bialata TaxID=797122 RepID=A0A9K3CSG3_9EUKA|nr:hypothetical protein KIPB_002573 [Kipferlia bialata]|eukprot:g2573.t1
MRTAIVCLLAIVALVFADLDHELRHFRNAPTAEAKRAEMHEIGSYTPQSYADVYTILSLFSEAEGDMSVCRTFPSVLSRWAHAVPELKEYILNGLVAEAEARGSDSLTVAVAIRLSHFNDARGLAMLKTWMQSGNTDIMDVLITDVPAALFRYEEFALINDFRVMFLGDYEAQAAAVAPMVRSGLIDEMLGLRRLHSIATMAPTPTARMRAVTVAVSVYGPDCTGLLLEVATQDEQEWVATMASYYLREAFPEEPETALLPTPLGSYKKSTAVNYAYSWYSSCNHDCSTSYSKCTPWSYWGSECCGFPSQGGDCANFVSQSLIAGGHPNLNGGSPCRGYPCGKEEVGANNLDNCLAQHHGWTKTCGHKLATPSNIVPGDVIVYHKSSCSDSSAHATLVTEVKNGKAYITCHSSDHKNQSYDYMFGSKPYISFLHY